MPFLADNLFTVLMLLSAVVGLWLAMAQRRFQARRLGVAVATFSLIGVIMPFETPGVGPVEHFQFWVCSIGALTGGISMISSRNPVHGALWFAVATMSVCGLFLLQAAPFLAAATIIVYAGAIIVTFLFVIMLAQQNGVAAYDRNARGPTMAILMSAVVLVTMVAALHDFHGDSPMALADQAERADQADNNDQPVRAESVAPEGAADTPAELGAMHSLGRSLFVDHLLAVELAGTLLLIATVGAILLAPRRATGTL
jgi:NADH-quinone oxidoreductase subunit J